MRILIIEDDFKIARAIKKGLEQETYAVDISSDGSDGFGQANTIDYDLIILDRMLPEMDGIEICRSLRKNGKTTPIIMLTAKSQIKDRVEGLDCGADDYLVKPFSFEELVARIRALLRRPSDLKESVVRVADLSLDPILLTVERGGREVNLSAKEFALLEYLMRNEGRVLTKDNIISHVWDYDADILPNTLEVFIGSLRSKIDKPFEGEPLIKTVRGFGYKIDADTKN
ncbi:MAG: Transcriptional regulatory protein CusR [candidate division WS2 bacterium ADurb.Bin280]|uniref:Transcriptional regulatory protein CusR n=1 Tax=candidate division WS2 bacterium ADurb.Bin280 TaxID=1852829 RepID=A0A1V5SBK9_9BACT|nr:MAG: Transcriptional regulatory protein CusR [candidate division WS2 bacterium ADurb.Bin280]